MTWHLAIWILKGIRVVYMLLEKIWDKLWDVCGEEAVSPGDAGTSWHECKMLG